MRLIFCILLTFLGGTTLGAEVVDVIEKCVFQESELTKLDEAVDSCGKTTDHEKNFYVYLENNCSETRLENTSYLAAGYCQKGNFSVQQQLGVCRTLCYNTGGCLLYNVKLNNNTSNCWLSWELSGSQLFFRKLSPESCGFGAALAIIVVILGFGIKACWHYFYDDEYEDVVFDECSVAPPEDNDNVEVWQAPKKVSRRGKRSFRR